MARLEGKTAIVTGGGDGIGYGIVQRLATDGARVLVAELNEEKGRACAEEAVRTTGGDVSFRRVDVTQKDEVTAMVAHAVDALGGCDILVNNAWGGGTIKRIENKTDEELAHGFTMAFYAAVWAMRSAFPYMKARGWGRIVNMCSLNGVNAHIGSAEYNSSKEALRSFSRTAAREWAGYGITCNIVCPASISAAYRGFQTANPEAANAMAAMNPMGRIGDPQTDIAPVVAFLASDDSRYVTGNTLFVDGGSHINGVAWAPQLPD